MSYYECLQHVLYRSNTGNSCENEAPLSWLPAVRKGDVQTLGHQEFHSNVLKFALLHRHLLHVTKLILKHCVAVQPKRLYAREGAVAQELQKITLQESRTWSAPSGDEEREISQTHTSQLEVDPRSIVCTSFTLKSACVFRS